MSTAASPASPLPEIGSATVTSWADAERPVAPGVRYYLVRAENAGGGEQP